MTANPTADLLRSALALIEQPEHWCQGAYCRDVKGKKYVSPMEAVRWCAEGACMHVATPHHAQKEAFTDAYETLASVIGSASLSNWNDAPERTHAEVVAAFRRAIAIAEGGA